MKVPSREDWDIGRGRVVLILTAYADIAHRPRIERSGVMMVTVALARTDSQDCTDDLRKRVGQDDVAEDPYGVRHDLLHRETDDGGTLSAFAGKDNRLALEILIPNGGTIA